MRPLTETVIVAGQISPETLEIASTAGVTTVICNRPDGEEPGQPAFAEIEAAATAAGMTAVHVPLTGGAMPDAATIAAHGAALAGAEGKVLAYCRSGMRSTMLWALSQAGTAEADALIATAAEAGYDISGLRAALSAG